MGPLSSDYLKNIIEALLFISEKPVTIEQLKDTIEDVGTAEIKQCLGDLVKEFEEDRRGMAIVEIAGGYQMLSSPHYARYIRNFFKTRVKEKLSRPALETLAIIAYKQPVSRSDIELIRGVNSDGVMAHLLGKGIIKILGRRDVPGRPYVYGTTKLFLEYFGLKSLDDLPRLEQFSELFSGAGQQAPVLAREEGDSLASEAQATKPADVASKENIACEGQPALMDAVQHKEEGQDDALSPSPDDEEKRSEAREGTAVEDVAQLKHVMDEMHRTQKSPDSI